MGPTLKLSDILYLIFNGGMNGLLIAVWLGHGT